MTTDPLEQLEKSVYEMNEYMHRHSRTVFGRYPLVFGLLTTFGVVTMLYGFEDFLGSIPLLHEHPILPFLGGFAILIFTGSLYKRLEKKLN